MNIILREGLKELGTLYTEMAANQPWYEKAVKLKTDNPRMSAQVDNWQATWSSIMVISCYDGLQVYRITKTE